jgi:hypothetical protein
VRQSVVNLIRGAVVKRGVTALVIVKAYPLLQAVAKLGATAEGMQVKVIVFDGPPQPFNEDVVLASAEAVHTDGDPVVLEDLSKTVASELCSLVGVEDLRFSITPLCQGSCRMILFSLLLDILGAREERLCDTRKSVKRQCCAR